MRESRCDDESGQVLRRRKLVSDRRVRIIMTQTPTDATATRDIAVDLECDDEFEEFAHKEWSTDAETGAAEATQQWENEWDDDASAMTEDFPKQLRAELTTREGGK